MAFKFVVFFAIASAVSAGVIPVHDNLYDHHHHHAAIIQPTLIKKVIEHEAPANYEFNYDVHDTHTGDIKQQHEKAQDGHISGQYSLIDADGYRRIVDYTADDHHGFQANVHREPLHHEHHHAQPVVVKKVVAQPIQKYYSAPAHVQHYSAPSHVQHYSAPSHVQHFSAPSHVEHHLSSPVHYSHHY